MLLLPPLLLAALFAAWLAPADETEAEAEVRQSKAPATLLLAGSMHSTAHIVHATQLLK
jgi:hypothetical protein